MSYQKQDAGHESSLEALRRPVSVVVPAYNEAEAVGAQVEKVLHVLSSSELGHEVIVVDDGSYDLTAEEAARAGARVLKHAENRGYGAALKTGMGAAANEIIVIIDADGTYPADQIPTLVAKLETADMAVGKRTGEKVSIPLVRRPAKWLLGWLANRVAGTRIPDLNSGLRAFWRDCVGQYSSILSNRFSFTTTATLALIADDYRVAYHPINYYQRIGKSKIVPRHFMDFIFLVLRMAMLFQPLRVFVPLGATCGLVGMLKVVYDIVTLFSRAPTIDLSLVYQPLLSTSAVLLLLVGLQLILIGMVADGVLRRIAQSSGPLVPSRATYVPTVDFEARVTPREDS